MIVAVVARLYAAAAAAGVVVVDSAGLEYTKGRIDEVCERLADASVEIGTLDAGLLSRVVDAYLAAGQGAYLDVAMRGQGLVGAPTLLSIRRTGWRCRWHDLAGLHPDGDPDSTAADLGLGRRPAAGLELAAWLARLDAEWRAFATAELGDELGVTLAATAARLAIPRQWRTAFRAAATPGRRPGALTDAGWRIAQRAYYGGRVTCRAPGWRGEAVEYDLRSAYGWALCQRLPDWKVYDRKPWPSEPAWYDVTVRVDGELGPLPARDVDDPRRLTYPAGGVELRGTWTRDELDRAGVKVLEVHQVLAGRWSYDLQPVVSAWLERRELGGALRRRLFRFLPNALAGKLSQRSIGWILWDPADGDPPAGAQPLGLDSRAFAVPVPAAYQPVTCPQAGSYVTSLVRSRVWRELSRPEALYSDTDSVHLPAGSAPPADVGDAPGQWAEKARGWAVYNGPKQYEIGSKRVGAPLSIRRRAGLT